MPPGASEVSWASIGNPLCVSPRRIARETLAPFCRTGSSSKRYALEGRLGFGAAKPAEAVKAGSSRHNSLRVYGMQPPEWVIAIVPNARGVTRRGQQGAARRG